jgi:uncharacterized protein YuzB (UPF0349 family)
VKPIVEFCQSNLAAGTMRVKEKLEEEGKVDVVEYGCMGFCGECYEAPYALVNGNMVIGESPKDLLEKIRAEIKQYEEEGQ